MIQTVRFAAHLGLIASSVAIASIARADIPITGGQVTGAAAFFTQTNVSSTSTTTSLTRSTTCSV